MTFLIEYTTLSNNSNGYTKKNVTYFINNLSARLSQIRFN